MTVVITSLTSVHCGTKRRQKVWENVSDFLYPFHSLFFSRLVNEILADELKLIHAFEQRTLTPEQWEKEQEAK